MSEGTTTIVYGGSYKENTPYTLILPTRAPVRTLEEVQVAYVRREVSPELVEAADDREFTVAWCLVPAVPLPEGTSVLQIGEEEAARRAGDSPALGLVYGVSVYNPNDAKTGDFFNKHRGTSTALQRLREQLEGLRQEDASDTRLSGVEILSIRSGSCRTTQNGYLQLPRVGAFLYRAVQDRVKGIAAEEVSLSRDLISNMWLHEARPVFSASDEDRIYTFDQVIEEGDSNDPDVLNEELSDREEAPNSASGSDQSSVGCGGCGNCECNRAG